MKQFVIAAKPIAPLDPATGRLLEACQRDLKRRFKSYKRGMQQGLPMVWDNMMLNLKKIHELNKNA